MAAEAESNRQSNVDSVGGECVRFARIGRRSIKMTSDDVTTNRTSTLDGRAVVVGGMEVLAALIGAVLVAVWEEIRRYLAMSAEIQRGWGVMLGTGGGEHDRLKIIFHPDHDNFLPLSGSLWKHRNLRGDVTEKHHLQDLDCSLSPTNSHMMQKFCKKKSWRTKNVRFFYICKLGITCHKVVGVTHF